MLFSILDACSPPPPGGYLAHENRGYLAHEKTPTPEGHARALDMAQVFCTVLQGGCFL